MNDPIFQIKTERETPTEGVFVIEPLEQGYGNTIGNPLRRVLLSSLPGAAITFVKIAGVRHQFTTLPGLKEDIVELILNLKKIRMAYDGEKPTQIELDVTGPGEVKAGDIKCPSGASVINKDLVLGHLADKKSKLSIEMTVEKGYGYSPFEDRKSDILGVIPIDAIFTPVVRVNQKIEATRVGRMTNFDKLILEIYTDGTIAPSDALKQATQTLLSYFEQLINPKKVEKTEEKKPLVANETAKLTIEELTLPTRIVNALEKAGYKTVEDLLLANPKDVAKIKNLGSKSLKIIAAALNEKGVSFGE